MAARTDSEDPALPSPHVQMRWGVRALAAFMGAGLAATVVYAASTNPGQDSGAAAALGILVAGACLTSGGFLGFLFGIPRTRTQDSDDAESDEEQQPADGARLPRYTPNTNLEQISDWLTKILVGVGLTQLGTLPAKLDGLASYLAPAFAGSKAMALAVLVFFWAGGFLIGFLWTRLYLKRAMQAADEVYRELRKTKKRLAVVSDAQALDASLRKLVDLQLAPQGPEVSVDDLRKALSLASPHARAQAFDRAARVRTETWRQDKPWMQRTIPIFRALIAVDDTQQYHRNYGQLGFALKDSLEPAWEEAKSALSKAIEIRDRSGDASSAWFFYEYVRAQCSIALDPDFHAGKPAAAPLRTQILADLRVALGLGEIVRNDALVSQWVALNQINLAALAPPAP